MRGGRVARVAVLMLGSEYRLGCGDCAGSTARVLRGGGGTGVEKSRAASLRHLMVCLIRAVAARFHFKA